MLFSKSRFLTTALALLTLVGCSPSGENQSPAGAALLGETAQRGAFLAYEHSVGIRLPVEQVEPRLAAVREACSSQRFGQCDLLAIEQSQGHYQAASISVRIAPAGVEPLVGFAGEGGELQSRHTRAEDLAQAVSDTEQQRQRLERQQKTLLQYQARSDLSVSDMLALARELAEVEVQLAGAAQQSAQQQRRLTTNLLTLSFSTEGKPVGRLARIGEAAGGMLDNATEGATEALKLLGYGIPFVIILFPLALLIRWLWRKASRARNGI
ncbi:hypothetical protein DNK06_14995 [Pseudomonas daroniae]|uniref:DUF4349 domain-containing protein n=1 Tax=Phytopseudomonas daroniae TaxID=2487519 RepID=A0A4Q9QJM0_9GAMM|nr:MULTISPECIES: DUF4349 domain-containing protein [Pseudomonas]TBU77621.1 hypothetical protein DNK06_14995 [Pseudomonas daroniae]TBU85772.1 hypothetical protein DNK31_00470 [Pseudomonas sp. FRB 228]TBU94935.1 hypothetical protein DNJ99_00470 [Pseudomonas daroniae]